MAEGFKQSSRFTANLKVWGEFLNRQTVYFNYSLTSLLAFIYVGQALTFSKYSTDKIINNFLASAEKHGMPTGSIESL